MRKLITILGTIGLLTTTTTTVVACTDSKESSNPVTIPDNPTTPTKTLLNEKITINDDQSVTVTLFYYDGSEIAFLIDKDNVLNPTFKELKLKIDQINQNLISNRRELAMTKAGIISLEQALLTNSQAISEAQVPFDRATLQYQAIERILNGTSEKAANYQNIVDLLQKTKNELDNAQKQLTYAKNIYKINLENQAVWSDKIAWLEENSAVFKDEKLAAVNDLIALLEVLK